MEEEEPLILPRYFGHQEKTLYCVRRCSDGNSEATTF
jgi:hypothetical protein